MVKIEHPAEPRATRDRPGDIVVIGARLFRQDELAIETLVDQASIETPP